MGVFPFNRTNKQMYLESTCPNKAPFSNFQYSATQDCKYVKGMPGYVMNVAVN
jgi:hypothetical protein